MDNFRIYSQATAGLLFIEAAPLLISPSMTAWMVSAAPRGVSDLESLVARELGFTLVLGSFLTLLFSGELNRLWNDADAVPAGSATSTSPYSSATTIATLLYNLSTGILFYMHSYSRELSGSLLTMGGVTHLALGVAGLLVLVFANDGKISKRTGADKRTSGFPFKNKEAGKKRA